MATATTPSSLFPCSASIHHHHTKHKTTILSTSIFINNSQPLNSSLTLSKHKHLHYFFTQKPRNLKPSIAATPEDGAVIASETTQEIVSATTSGDDGVSIVISTLLFIAFVALSILTIGVIYIAVTEFLTNREKERFEKEEEAKKSKKVGKKGKAKARAGPRGFGQKKVDEFEDD